MKKRLLCLFVFTVFAASVPAQTTTDLDAACKNYSIESAMRVIEMAKRAESGTMPTDKEWQNLFATEGYRTAFRGRRDSLEWHNNIRNAFTLVFDQSQQAKVDSIVSRPIGEKTPFEEFFVHNFHLLKSNLDWLDEFIHNTDFSALMRTAHATARKHLPARIDELEITFERIYLVVWDIEDRAWTNGIYLNLPSCCKVSKDELINTIAHELHHHYMGPLIESRYTEDSNDPALYAIFRNQLEGTADIINKQTMPAAELGLYGPEIVKTYNDDYFASPEVLKELDSLTCNYLAGKITEKEYRKARECAHCEGHTTGDYMVFLIRDQLGLQAAVDCLGDFAGFVRTYNEAARKAGTYVFSDTFTGHIDKVCRKMEGK